MSYLIYLSNTVSGTGSEQAAGAMASLFAGLRGELLEPHRQIASSTLLSVCGFAAERSRDPPANVNVAALFFPGWCVLRQRTAVVLAYARQRSSAVYVPFVVCLRACREQVIKRSDGCFMQSD